MCHDYGHDGFNNAYHVKTESARFAQYGAESVQERYHFAESFKVLEETQVLAGLSAEDQSLFKRRMQ